MARSNLSVSGAPTRWFSVSTSGTTVYGTTSNDQLSANASNMTLVGNGGDDTFIVYDPSDIVIETPNSGISTVETWGAGYTLPDNVENLTLEGASDAYAVGNNLNNILTANSGNDRLVAGTGNDILVGGPGDDTFVVAAGDGQDEIQNFQVGAGSGDVVELQGFGFTSFADVQAAMTQSGADTVLNLGGGQSIIFDSTTVGSFAAGNFDLPFDSAGMTMSFDDEFTSLSLNIGGGTGTWHTTFDDGSRTLARNGELEEYMDPAYAGTGSQPLGVNPFSVSDGILGITAQPTSPSVAPYIANMPYTSGLLTTEGSFAQTYGYWEIGAELPKGNGLWPAFWLLPTDHSWPPEVDILEALGNDPSTIYNSFHGSDGSGFSQATHVGDLSSGFHTFGFDWTSATMTWYVDGLPTARIATPAYMNKPMYMLMDLAVGGYWPGAPDAATTFPASLKIDYVRVYGLPPDSATLDPPSDDPPGPPAAPSDLALDTSTDSGVKGDKLTSATRPQIDGQGVAGDTIAVYDGTMVVGSGVVSSGGTWQIVSSGLANGTHNLTATQTDAAGSTSVVSAPLSLAIDTIPPVAPSGLALDLSTDSGINGDNTTNITRAGIDGRGVAGDTVTLHDGTTAVGSGIVGSTGDWQIITSALPFGANALSATETDNAGNVSASSVVLSLNILKPAVPTDLYGTGLSDLVLQNANTGQIEGWELNGTSVIANGAIGTPSDSGWAVADSSDLNGDGRADLILQNAGTGQVVGWEMNGTSVIASGTIGTPSDPSWELAGTGDLNGDGHTDLLLQSASNGQVWDWETSGTNVIRSADIGTPSDAGWKLAGVTDLNGDGCSDLIFQNAASGEVWAWEMNGTSVIVGADIGTPGDASWKLAAVGSLRGDGHTDLIFQSTNSGEVWDWETSGTSVIAGGDIGTPSSPSWKLMGLDDPNSSGHPELVFQNASDGQVWGWEMNGTSIVGGASIGLSGSAWHLTIG